MTAARIATDCSMKFTCLNSNASVSRSGSFLKEMSENASEIVSCRRHAKCV
jgi:hypothetical protein